MRDGAMRPELYREVASKFCRTISELRPETREKLYEIWAEAWAREHPEKSVMSFETWDKLMSMFGMNTDQIGLTRPEDSEDANPQQ